MEMCDRKLIFGDQSIIWFKLEFGQNMPKKVNKKTYFVVH